MTTVKFLKSGEVTWTSKSGKTEHRCYIRAGTKLNLRVVERNSEYELWDGDWSTLVPASVVRIES